MEILFEIKYRNSVLGDACLVESFAHVGFFLYWQSFRPEKPIIQGIPTRINWPGKRLCSWRMLEEFLEFCCRIWCDVVRRI